MANAFCLTPLGSGKTSEERFTPGEARDSVLVTAKREGLFCTYWCQSISIVSLEENTAILIKILSARKLFTAALSIAAKFGDNLPTGAQGAGETGGEPEPWAPQGRLWTQNGTGDAKLHGYTVVWKQQARRQSASALLRDTRDTRQLGSRRHAEALEGRVV